MIFCEKKISVKCHKLLNEDSVKYYITAGTLLKKCKKEKKYAKEDWNRV